MKQPRLSRRWMSGLIFIVIFVTGCVPVARGVWPGLTVVEEDTFLGTQHKLYRLDSEGNQQWAYPADGNGNYFVPPAIVDGVLYTADSSKHVYAVDAETGRGIWESTFEAADAIVAAVAVDENAVYAGISNNGVVALDRETGEQLWFFMTEHGVWAAPLLIDGVLYIASLDHYMYAIDVTDIDPDLPDESPEQLWRSDRLNGAIAETPYYDETSGRFFVGTLANRVYAISDGHIEAEFNTDGWVWSSPTLYAGRVYITDLSGNIYALNADDLTLDWQTSLPDAGGIRGGALVTEEGVFFGTESGLFYGLDRVDGSELWAPRDVDGKVLTRPTLLQVALDEDTVEDDAPATETLILVAPAKGQYTLLAYTEDGARHWAFEGD